MRDAVFIYDRKGYLFRRKSVWDIHSFIDRMYISISVMTNADEKYLGFFIVESAPAAIYRCGSMTFGFIFYILFCSFAKRRKRVCRMERAECILMKSRHRRKGTYARLGFSYVKHGRILVDVCPGVRRNKKESV